MHWPASNTVASSPYDPSQESTDKTRVLQQLSIKDVNQAPPTSEHNHGEPQQHLDWQKTTGEASESKKKPTLMTLPRELRDIIYQYALSQRVEIKEELQTPAMCGATLLCTSRQVYVEALQLYYENTTFFSRNPIVLYFWVNRSEAWFDKWLKDIHWEHDYERTDPAGSENHQFVNLRNILMRECARNVGEGVLKTVYYTPDGKLELSSGGEFP